MASVAQRRDTGFGGFSVPNWSAEEDIEGRIRAMPSNATAKGMFLQAVVDTAKNFGVEELTRQDYTSFKDYPLREFIDLAVSAVPRIYPGLPLREGLRRLGQQVYPMFANTMIGTAIFSVAARSWPQTMRLATRAYAVSIKPGSASVTHEEPGRGIVEFRSVWSFPDSYQVGIFEGAMQLLGVRGDIRVRVHSPCDADLLITWA
jgi:uncharacterized protein (TIGR02265 family)